MNSDDRHMKPDGWIVHGLHPKKPNVSFIVIPIVESDSPSAKTMRRWMERGYEGDGAFYLLTTEVWASRTLVGNHVSVQIFCVEQPTPILERVIQSQANHLATLAPTTLLVSAQRGASKEEILQRLHSGEEWPVVVGPRPGNLD